MNWFFSAAIAVALTGTVFSVGALYGDSWASDGWRKRVAAAGCAQFDPRSGVWEWKPQ